MFGLVLTVAWVCLLGYGLTELVRLALTDPKVPPTPRPTDSQRPCSTMLKFTPCKQRS